MLKISVKRYITSVLCLFCFAMGYAWYYPIEYSKGKNGLKWTITGLKDDEENEVSKIEITVTNVSNDTQSIDTSKTNFYLSSEIYSNKYGYPQMNSSSRIIFLQPRRYCSFILKFSDTNGLQYEDKFSISVPGFINLTDISVKKPTIEELSAKLTPWDKFYETNRKHKLTYETSEEANNALQTKYQQWMQKGEFETTDAWNIRINDDQTVADYVNKLKASIETQHKEEMDMVKTEQEELAQKYQEYKNKTLKEYYDFKIGAATHKFIKDEFTLMPYDADHQSFMIQTSRNGDILLPVPMEDAPEFKTFWESIKKTVKPEFLPNGEDVVLSKVTFKNGSSSYTYDSNTVAQYSSLSDKFEYHPLDIADIVLDKLDYESDKPSSTLSTITYASNSGKKSGKSKNSGANKNKSDLDHSIPQNKENEGSTTFAVIVANEDYENVAEVPFALNDGEIFSKYLTQTIGIPADHLKTYFNATYGNMKAMEKHIKNLSEAYGDKLKLIIYYSGHGMPDEKSRECMLIPVDGDSKTPETCFKLEPFYNFLNQLEANSIVMFMDACFSGSVRGDEMMHAARGVKLKPNTHLPQGNMVVFSAAQGDETAYPYENEEHGMFTYFLLKKLQQSKGKVSLGELGDYVVEEVKHQSVITNGKLQTPIVHYSPKIGDAWKNWKLD